MGHRVRRQELFEDGDSSSGDDADSRDIQQILLNVTNARFGTPEPVPLEPEDVAQDIDGRAVEEEALEFRLFAHQRSKSPRPTKIRLNSPDTSNKAPGFVVPERPRSFYFQDSWSADEQHQFDATAVSGSDIIERSKTFWHGFALPWRVTTIQSDKPAPSLPSTKNPTFRKRPGKKSRITRRIVLAAAEGEAERRRREQEAKEVAVRDKKTRINNIKKMRRREKKRQEKAAAGVNA
jgi:hypothetical protein